MAQLNRDPIFTSLTRPQMFAGVTYVWFVFNAVVTAELFLITKSPWVFLVALIIHIGGVIAARDEPRFMEIFMAKAARAPRIANWKYWRCNSYGP